MDKDAYNNRLKVKKPTIATVTLKMEPVERVQNCLTTFNEEFGVPALVEVDDVISEKPDEKTLMTYSALIRHTLHRRNEAIKSPIRISNEKDWRSKFLEAENQNEVLKSSSADLKVNLVKLQKTFDEERYHIVTFESTEKLMNTYS